jgi:predicted Zn-dependent protease
MTADELLERLERALKRFGGDAELSFSGVDQGTTRFADSRVTQSGDVRDRVVQARVAVGPRVGAARTGALDEAALAAVLVRAKEIALAQREAPEFTGFDDGRMPTPPCAPSFDEAAAGADAATRAQLIAPAFAASARARLGAAGLAAVSTTTVAVATSAGCRRAHRFTLAKLDVIASEAGIDGASGRSSRVAVALQPLVDNAVALAVDAVERAARSRDAALVDPGAYDVVLEPPAVAELLEWLSITSLGARAVADGSSALAGRRGERITGGQVTVYDDALAGEQGCPTLPFDAEGTPRRRLAFIDGGVAGEPAHDRASAAQAGTRSTGHAPPIGDELLEEGPTPQHLHLAAGADDLAALIGRVERGLLVSRFHYVNGLLDTRRALMTGMTRDGLWLIENGRLGRAVRNLRWTESLLEAWLRLDGVTHARRLMTGSLNDTCFVCPTLLVRGWRFTGQSR